jgi:hypothetical protein
VAWVRIDDHFPDHPKIVSVGPLAAWLHVAGLCYCNRMLTNGFIPMSQVDRLSPHREDQDIHAHPMNLAQRLCDFGLWMGAERKGVPGFLIHDYLKYQHSKKYILEDRAKTAARQGLFRNGHRNAVTNAVSHAPVTPVPTPTPTPTLKREKKELSSADADFEAFRLAYPVSRRVGGKPGRDAFQRSGIGRHGDSLATVLLALEQQKRSEQWHTPKLIPLMTTWLNQERWLQVLPEAGASASKLSREAEADATLALLKRREAGDFS